MKYSTSVYNGLRVSFTRCALGETHQFRVDAPTPRADVAHTSYMGGEFRYEMPDGSTLVDMHRGTLGIDLPDFPEAGLYTLRAMEEGAQYFCISAIDARRTSKKRINLSIGESYVLLKGGIAVVDGTDLALVVAQTSDVRIDGPCVGLEVWA